MTSTTCSITPAMTVLLVLGCSSEHGMTDPAVRTHGDHALLSAKQFSDWTTPVALAAVNSAATDQHPTLSKDGLSLYFASSRGSGDQNIWIAQRACTDPNCPWGEPVMLGDAVNSGSLEAAPALSRDEHQLFFSSQRGGTKPRWDGDTCTAAPCDRDLWVSYREDVHDDFGWQPAVNVGPPVNTNGEEVAPTYFENDDSGLPQLLFNDGVLNSAGVLVLGDIYVSQLTTAGAWSAPAPVGEVNTACSDQRPSISHDGLQLYFHSTRLTSGGCGTVARIWVTTRGLVSEAWSAPTLVPAPISDAGAIHPFIHSLGRIETLLLVRGGDILMSQRSRTHDRE